MKTLVLLCGTLCVISRTTFVATTWYEYVRKKKRRKAIIVKWSKCAYLNSSNDDADNNDDDKRWLVFWCTHSRVNTNWVAMRFDYFVGFTFCRGKKTSSNWSATKPKWWKEAPNAWTAQPIQLTSSKRTKELHTLFLYLRIRLAVTVIAIAIVPVLLN